MAKKRVLWNKGLSGMELLNVRMGLSHKKRMNKLLLKDKRCKPANLDRVISSVDKWTFNEKKSKWIKPKIISESEARKISRAIFNVQRELVKLQDLVEFK